MCIKYIDSLNPKYFEKFANEHGRVFVTADSFLNITAKTGIVNLSEINYYEIIANEHHHISPQKSGKYSYVSLANLSEISFYEIHANEQQHTGCQRKSEKK